MTIKTKFWFWKFKFEEYFIVHCWKQGRLSNIFETEITYFSQFFFTFMGKLIKKKDVNIHIWNCKGETELLTPKLNMILKLYIYIYI